MSTHVCLRVIVELPDGRNNLLRPAEGADCVVNCDEIDKARVQHKSTDREHRVGSRRVRSGTTLFLRQDSHALVIVTEVAKTMAFSSILRRAPPNANDDV